MEASTQHMEAVPRSVAVIDELPRRHNTGPSRTVTATWVALLASVALLGCTGCRPKPAIQRAMVSTAWYGDSISWQSSDYLEYFFRAEGGKEITVSAVGGTALCDWVPQIVNRIRSGNPPRRVVLSFYGNNLTACMGGDLSTDKQGWAVGSPEFLSVYRSGMDEVAAAARRSGVEIAWVTPPPRSAIDPSPGLNTVFNDMAERRGWRVIKAGERDLQTQSGGFAMTLPCAVVEVGRAECISGRIQVRDDDRVHFHRPGGPGASYGAGALRWAAAAMAALARP